MKVIVSGSFDPITKGHEDIILRASKNFDGVIVAILNNETKSYEFSLEEREKICKAAFKNEKNVRVVSSDGMLFELCRKENCFLILRGIRNYKDMQYEIKMAMQNKEYEPRIETVFLPADKSFEDLSSTNVRNLIKEGKAFEMLVPENSVNTIKQILENRKGKKNEK